MERMSKQEAIGWIEVIKRQPFPVVTFDALKKLYQIAGIEHEYPKHDYLIASSKCDSEIMNQISGRI
jgi:hypothetical protein